ncbi:MAG: hypothetical protein ACQEXJ_07770 [Myxococcota bacterium]
MTRSEPTAPARWDEAIDRRASPLGRERLALVPEQGISRRFLAVTASTGPHEAWAWVSGHRNRIRPGLHQVILDAAGEDHAWIVRWVMGRWPKGPLVLGTPLTPDLVPALTLGIVAPLKPTRIGLVESPVPFPIPSVKHMKALHARTGEEGLVGCRLHVRDGAPTAVAGRWPVDPRRLPEIAETWDLREAARDLALPAVEGLVEGIRAASRPVLEAAWTPEPVPAFVVEVGPTSVARVVGLVQATLGDERAEPLVEAARDLRQKAAWRVRLTVGGDGLTAITTLLGPKQQPLEATW